MKNIKLYSASSKKNDLLFKLICTDGEIYCPGLVIRTVSQMIKDREEEFKRHIFTLEVPFEEKVVKNAMNFISSCYMSSKNIFFSSDLFMEQLNFMKYLCLPSKIVYRFCYTYMKVKNVYATFQIYFVWLKNEKCAIEKLLSIEYNPYRDRVFATDNFEFYDVFIKSVNNPEFSTFIDTLEDLSIKLFSEADLPKEIYSKQSVQKILVVNKLADKYNLKLSDLTYDKKSSKCKLARDIVLKIAVDLDLSLDTDLKFESLIRILRKCKLI